MFKEPVLVVKYFKEQVLVVKYLKNKFWLWNI